MINTVRNLEKQRRKANKRLARIQKHMKAHVDADKMIAKYENQIASYDALIKKTDK